MPSLPEAISRGHYARKQLLSRNALVAWSHRRRFETAIRLACECSATRLLDYGCGDGTFLGLLMMEPGAPLAAVGADRHEGAVNDCRDRYRDEPCLAFVNADEIDGAAHRGRYDAVFCMEVFEHVVDVDAVLARLSAALAEGGQLVISVPVETGLPLIAKQIVRRVAGWRGVGHYPGTTPYTPAEMLRAVWAGRRQHLTRPIFDHGSEPFYDHKGFNWMAFRERLAARFVIERSVASPFPRLGPHLATQVWFVARRRSGASA